MASNFSGPPSRSPFFDLADLKRGVFRISAVWLRWLADFSERAASITTTGLTASRAVFTDAAGDLTTKSNADAFAAIKQAASTTATGVSERATDAEAVTGTDTERHITPANLTARLAAPGNIGATTPGAITGTTLKSETGVVILKETTTPTALPDYGKIYTKNDNKLYFQDGAGNEHEVQFV